MLSESQIDAKLNQPLPADEDASLEVTYVTPNCSEAVINLEMDYLLSRKSSLTKYLFSALPTVSLIGIWMAGSYYWVLQDYFSAYNFRDGLGAGLKSLLGNTMFRYDLIEASALAFLGIAVSWIHTSHETEWLKEKSKEVPENEKAYFSMDMSKYAELTAKTSKFNSSEKAKVNFFKKNSVVIFYRKTPIAFLVKQTEGEVSRVTALGIRRVYIKTGILEDLLRYVVKEVDDTKSGRAEIELYSFEKPSQMIVQKLGFVLEHKEPLREGLFLNHVYGQTTNTYVYRKKD